MYIKNKTLRIVRSQYSIRRVSNCSDRKADETVKESETIRLEIVYLFVSGNLSTGVTV